MSKFDTLLKKAEMFEKLAVYGDRKDFLKALAYEPSPQGQAPATPPASYPAISPETQNQLNDLLVPGGEIFMLNPDGKLGPKTQAALAKFKAKYNMPATAANIKQMHQLVNMNFPAK